MSGTIFTLWLTVILCLVKSAAFFVLALFDRSSLPPRWLGLAFLAAALSFGGEIVLATGFAPKLTGLLIALAIVAMFILIAKSLCLRYRTPAPAGIALAIFAACVLHYGLVLNLPHNDLLYQVLYQLPYALLSLLTAAIIVRAPRKSIADWVFVALFALIAAHFLAKPFFAQQLGGVGGTAAQFSTTLYGAFSVAASAVLLVVMATVALGVMIHDSAKTLIGRAERDGETGLYNRDGFAIHAGRFLHAAARSGLEPVQAALIVLALDNPRPHGPAEPLRTLARLVSGIAPQGALIGRMADSELAILSPGQNLFAARDTAEALREQAARPGQTEAMTLSIGITEREPGEVYPEMLARGLWALDEAQKAGGDCIRLAARSDFGIPFSRT